MLLVVAWDGACFDVVDPLIAEGRLPVLAAMLSSGARREVDSTVPPVTFPAWTTFATAASPARHGVTDFTVRDGYRVRFLNATHRRLPPVWTILDAAGLRAGVYALPATFPPEPIDGVLVCGFDTPLGAGRLGARTHPAVLASRLTRRYGDLAVGGPQQVRIDAGWHARALVQLLDTIERRTRIVADLITEQPFDFFLVHYQEPDTVAHHFWQFVDPASPRYQAGGPSDAVAHVYQALDHALGRLLEAAGPDTDTMIVSDHGSGGVSDRAIFWNRWLADRGYLRFRRRAAGARMARKLKGLALSGVPSRLQASAFAKLPRAVERMESGARLGGIDWSATTAFSEELAYHPSIWLNLAGREPQGAVAPEDRPALLERLRRDLADMRDPFDGGPVVERAIGREELGNGPAAAQMADLVLELRRPAGYAYASASSRGGTERASIRRMRPAEMTGARGTSMAGAHRAVGMCVAAGKRVRPGIYPRGRLADAGATAMALCGVAPAAGADGVAWMDVVEPAARRAAPPTVTRTARDYSVEEEREVAERLRALGYVD